MDAVRLPICICDGVLLKIGKGGGEPVATFLEPYKGGVNGVPLFFWVQRGDVAQGTGKAFCLPIGIFNVVCDEECIFIGNRCQLFPVYLNQFTCR